MGIWCGSAFTWRTSSPKLGLRSSVQRNQSVSGSVRDPIVTAPMPVVMPLLHLVLSLIVMKRSHSPAPVVAGA